MLSFSTEKLNRNLFVADNNSCVVFFLPVFSLYNKMQVCLNLQLNILIYRCTSVSILGSRSSFKDRELLKKVSNIFYIYNDTYKIFNLINLSLIISLLKMFCERQTCYKIKRNNVYS